MAKVQFPRNSVVMMIDNSFQCGKSITTVGAWFYEDKITSCIFLKAFQEKANVNWVNVLASYCEDFAFNGSILDTHRIGFTVQIKHFYKGYKEALVEKEELSMHILDLKEEIDLYELYLMVRGASMALETTDHPFFKDLDLKKFPFSDIGPQSSATITGAAANIEF